MSFAFVDEIGRRAGRLALLTLLAIGLAACGSEGEDDLFRDYWPVVCETDADCDISCSAPRVPVCRQISCECGEPPREPRCGDGERDDGEECDDGNDVSGDGCEPDCTRLTLNMTRKCLSSAPVLDDVGRFVPDEQGDPTTLPTTVTDLDGDGSCTFYVTCPIGTRAALPVRVWPLAPYVAATGGIRIPLEQGWSLTGAIRADQPEMELLDFGGGRVEYAPRKRPREYSPYYSEILFPAYSEGPVPLPLPGEPAQWLDMRRSEWPIEDEDGTNGFFVDWLHVELSTIRTPGVPTVCPVIGDASVVYLPGDW